MASKLLDTIDQTLQFVTYNPLLDEINTSFLDIDAESKDVQQSIVTNTETFYRTKHIQFVLKLQKSKESYEYAQMQHMRMQVFYWALCFLDLTKSLHHITSNNSKQEIIAFVEQCYVAEVGGFGGNIDLDAHLLNTLSAVQIIYLLNAEHVLHAKRIQIIQWIASLQTKEGSFSGDRWGESDTRYTYAALNALSLLNGLQSVDLVQCKTYLTRCRNFDGGYGTKPGAESHSGMIFCAVASLAIINAYDVIDVDVLNWWLCERQVVNLDNLDEQRTHNPLFNGGLNGRPMKLPDVCYSWWCLSAMKICDKVSWINKRYLLQFILNAQDVDDGGISDRPGYMPDIYHTYFGIGGLSLLGLWKEFDLNQIDPIWALPTHLCRSIGLYKRHPYADVA
eukprot:383895_1